jgi:hypothetical protein
MAATGVTARVARHIVVSPALSPAKAVSPKEASKTWEKCGK